MRSVATNIPKVALLQMVSIQHGLRTRHISPYECQGPLAKVDHQVPADFTNFLTMQAEIHDTTVHIQLQRDLVEHLWRLKGEASTALAP
jgi:hypothetical protein